MSQRIWLVLGLGALLAQCWMLYTPGSPEPMVPIPHIDKLVHFVIFAVPAFFFVRAGARWWLVAVLALLQSLLSEFVQERFLAYRGADPFDVVFDLLGAALGIWLGQRAGLVSGRA